MNSKHTVLRALVAVVAVASAAPALAQEHWTEGPVLSCDRYRVKEGKADAYARYLRTNVIPQTNAMKKAGLIVDRLYFLRSDGPADGWNYMSCIVDKNFAAFDYDAAAQKKMDDITAAQLKTADKARQAEVTNVRFDMREFLGTTTIREVVLKPLP